jgi:hypothetical protein
MANAKHCGFPQQYIAYSGSTSTAATASSVNTFGRFFFPQGLIQQLRRLPEPENLGPCVKRPVTRDFMC